MPKAKFKSKAKVASSPQIGPDVPPSPTTGKPARGPEIVGAMAAERHKPSDQSKPTLAKNDGPPETLEEEIAAGLTPRQKAELVNVEADIEARHREMEAVPPKSDLPYLEEDPLYAKQREDAQAAADAMFAEGVAAAPFEEQPFVEPTAEEIRAEVLGRIETARREQEDQLTATAAVDPNWEPGRNSAEGAKAVARNRENNF